MGRVAVRSGKWKYVENGLINMEVSRKNRATGAEAVYLADVTPDPGEKQNMRAQFPEIAGKLGKLHEQWRTAIANPSSSAPTPAPGRDWRMPGSWNWGKASDS
jgi:arylsulfatase A-like enzyme